MVAVIFPGQGSQKPGMGRELYDASPACRDVFESVGLAVGRDLRALCFEAEEETLRRTDNAQIALFTVAMGAFRALQPFLPREIYFAGHSVGEYAAVVASGALSLESGAWLVQRRGELMAQAGTSRPGAMSAVLGLDRARLEAICVEASSGGEVCVVANDNCPGQLVISGDREAVQRAGAAAIEAGAKRALPLPVSGAFHSPLMADAAREMGAALRKAEWQRQEWTVYANVTAEPVEHGREWAELLERQLVSPVRWTESVERMAADRVDTFVECGPGEVLCGLVKRIVPGARTLAVGTAQGWEAAQAALSQEVEA